MRDYPDAPNVYRINSTSSIFDIEQYQQRMLKAAATSNDYQRSYNVNTDIGNSNSYHQHHASYANSANLKHYKYDEMRDDDDSISKIQRSKSTKDQSNCYSLFGAITTAVAGSNCASAVHPIPDDSNSDKGKGVTGGGDVRHIRINERQYGQRKSLTQSGSINSYGYANNNYKNSYLLWIITPVAAR